MGELQEAPAEHEGHRLIKLLTGHISTPCWEQLSCSQSQFSQCRGWCGNQVSQENSGEQGSKSRSAGRGLVKTAPHQAAKPQQLNAVLLAQQGREPQAQNVGTDSCRWGETQPQLGTGQGGAQRAGSQHSSEAHSSPGGYLGRRVKVKFCSLWKTSNFSENQGRVLRGLPAQTQRPKTQRCPVMIALGLPRRSYLSREHSSASSKCFSSGWEFSWFTPRLCLAQITNQR